MTERSLIDESTLGIRWGDQDAMGDVDSAVSFGRTAQARISRVDAVGCAA